MPETVFFDYETRSKADIEVVGLSNYSEHPSTEILMLGYAFDDEPVQIWLPPDPMPARIRDALPDPSVTKISWYAEFERNISRRALGIDIPIRQFKDPMCLARSLSMPGSLDKVCDIMKLSEGQAKIKDGKRLLKLFSEPNGHAGEETLFGVNDGFYDARDFPKDWQLLIDYCKRDVEVERLLWKQFLPLSFPEEQWEDYWLSQEMNEVGMPLNVERARKALRLAQRYKDDSKKLLNEMTGLANANSVDQLLPWLTERGYPWSSINKDFVGPELKNPNSKLTPEARAVLTLRRKSSQTSYNKIEAILNQVSPDGRLRHMFMYMGAARTGRWSSAGGVNVQNLPRPIKEFKKLDPAYIFHLLDTEAYEEIMSKFDNSTLPFVASCIRMLFEVA